MTADRIPQDKLDEIKARLAYLVDGGMDHDGPSVMSMFKETYSISAALLTALTAAYARIEELERVDDAMVKRAWDSYASQDEGPLEDMRCALNAALRKGGEAHPTPRQEQR